MTLRVEGLGYRYPGSRAWVFRQLSFSLAKGQTLALLGPNGRGKTTLLKCLAGLLPPTEGRLQIAGTVGYVPQLFATPFAYTVRDVVLMGRARNLGMFASPTKADRRLADDALDALGVAHFAGRLINALSGGERQMVLMARALASGAETMLLDEPTAALDFRNQAILLSTLKRLAAERGLTIALTSHDPAHALEIADRALLMQAGGAYEEGPAPVMLDESRLSGLYGIKMRSAVVTTAGAERRTLVPDLHLPADSLS